MTMFLIRYGELALKSRPVRHRFQKRLIDNIHLHFVRAGLECRTEKDHGRIFLWADDDEGAADILARTFGIVSFSRVIETTSEQEDICETAAGFSKPLFDEAGGSSFAVRARRAGEHPYTSQTLARDVGSAIWYANEDHGPEVDLGSPEIEIFVEVRQNKAYIFSGKTPGPGGMPLGTQGKVLAHLEKERDPAAAWLMMKRGCKALISADDPGLMVPLEKWDPALKSLASPGSEVADLVELAWRNRAEGVVLGWDAARVEREAGHHRLPVYYPLLALSDEEIDGIMEGIMSA